MPDVLPWLAGLPRPLLLVVAGLLVTAEAGLLIGVALPGASAVIAIGVLARGGLAEPALAAATVALAAVVGTQLAYLRGRQGALPTPRRLHGPRGRALGLLERRGVAALGVAQWFAVTRTLTPRLAGYGGMTYRRFAAVSVPVAALWGATLTTLGYVAASAYDSLAQWFGLSAVAVLAAVAVVGWLVRRALARARRGYPSMSACKPGA
ncbi:DedA family protein [Prauserella endophytica]|uniref:DedA family protein n=1 Tax=Prauserella endophytica TaxID=1592324 RepID=A0ABY2S9N3_9PSEU|nr:VTT domain-containing protein [Prauserella endophytica]PXY29340.1 hypothetical protein BAY59_17220 [Prauserella coralliicola]TKG72332.1 hypothetical protein FCN18_08790 [Prauserella endophytica]